MGGSMGFNSFITTLLLKVGSHRTAGGYARVNTIDKFLIKMFIYSMNVLKCQKLYFDDTLVGASKKTFPHG